MNVRSYICLPCFGSSVLVALLFAQSSVAFGETIDADPVAISEVVDAKLTGTETEPSLVEPEAPTPLSNTDSEVAVITEPDIESPAEILDASELTCTEEDEQNCLQDLTAVSDVLVTQCAESIIEMPE